MLLLASAFSTSFNLRGEMPLIYTFPLGGVTSWVVRRNYCVENKFREVNLLSLHLAIFATVPFFLFSAILPVCFIFLNPTPSFSWNRIRLQWLLVSKVAAVGFRVEVSSSP